MPHLLLLARYYNVRGLEQILIPPSQIVKRYPSAKRNKKKKKTLYFFYLTVWSALQITRSFRY